jgi:hypothetical protein
MSYTNYNTTYPRNKILLAPGARMDSLFTPTSAQKHALGRIMEADDGTGRAWRYCLNGGVALTRAFMGQSEAPSANGLEIAQTGYTGSVGDVKFDILLTTGNSYSDGELADGWLLMNKSPTVGSTVGDMYLINTNKWTTSDTVMNITLADEGGLRTAFAASDELSVIKSPYRDIVVMPTTAAAKAVGVPLVDVTIAYYYWAQFKGPCPLIVDTSETVVIGEEVGYPGTISVAGTCGLVGAGTDAVWGTVLHVGAAAEPAIVDLMLP